ncbi:MAG: hypothetical protein ACYS21_13475 [Planctomycetota bacterium]
MHKGIASGVGAKWVIGGERLFPVEEDSGWCTASGARSTKKWENLGRRFHSASVPIYGR